MTKHISARRRTDEGLEEGANKEASRKIFYCLGFNQHDDMVRTGGLLNLVNLRRILY